MSNERWTYQVLEIAPGFRGGIKTELLQEELNRLGAQGWELVAVTSDGRGWKPAQMYLKRAQ